MSAIPTVPATAPPTGAQQSGSPAAERAGGQGDFAATLTDIATARTAPAEGHKETDSPAADDHPTGADRQPEQQPALAVAPVAAAPAEHAAPAPPAHDDADGDDTDATPAPDAAASAIPMASVLALTTAALGTPATVTSVAAATPPPRAPMEHPHPPPRPPALLRRRPLPLPARRPLRLRPLLPRRRRPLRPPLRLRPLRCARSTAAPAPSGAPLRRPPPRPLRRHDAGARCLRTRADGRWGARAGRSCTARCCRADGGRSRGRCAHAGASRCPRARRCPRRIGARPRCSGAGPRFPSSRSLRRPPPRLPPRPPRHRSWVSR